MAKSSFFPPGRKDNGWLNEVKTYIFVSGILNRRRDKMATTYLYAKQKERKLWLSSLMFYIMIAQIFCALVMDVFGLLHLGNQIIAIGYAGITIIGVALGIRYRDGFLPKIGGFDRRYIWYLAWMVIISIAYGLDPIANTTPLFGIAIPTRLLFVLTLSLMLIVSMVFTNTDYRQYTNYLFPLMIIILFVNFVFIIRAVSVYGNAIRSTNITASMGLSSILFGLPAYAIVYGFAILSPLAFVFVMLTKGDIYRKHAFIIAAVLAVSILVSQLATATIGMVLAIPLIYALKQKKGIKIVLLLLLALSAILLIVTDGIVEVLLLLEKLVPDDLAWNEKLLDMAEGFLDNEGSILQSRGELYLESWDTFKAAPLFGAIFEGKSYYYGGHSTFFDMLATVGLFGTVPFLMFIFESYKHAVRQLKTREGLVSVQAGYIIFLLFFIMKNTISSYAIFIATFVILPILAQKIDEYAVEKYEDEKGYFDENEK